MAVSSGQRALVAVGILLLLAGGAVAFYFYSHHGMLPSLGAGPAPDLMSLLPADAPVVAYADVAALRTVASSQLGAVLGLASPGPQADKDYADFVRDTGFDYTRDLDRAAVAAWPSSLAPAPGQTPIARMLALGDGRFDQNKIQAYTLRTGRVLQAGAHPIYEAPGESPGQKLYWMFVSPTRMALASEADLLAGLSNDAPHQRSPSIEPRIARVAGAPIFAVAATDSLPESVYANFAGSPQLEKLARSVKSLTLAGKPDGDNLKVTLDGECDSMKNALQISVMIDGARMLGSVALADPKNQGQMTREQAAFLDSLLRQMNVTYQDKWVRVTLTLTPAMLGPGTPSPHAANRR